MFKQKTIGVVVPAYCEEQLLPRTLMSMPAFVDHIIVVDDGSSDATCQVAWSCAQIDPRIHVIRCGFNYGVGHAIVLGYIRALDLDVDVVAVMAADNQMDPDELQDVILPIVCGEADYAKGNRLAHQAIDQMPRLRRWGTHVLGRITGLLAGFEQLDDAQCGYTAISRQMLERLPLNELYPRYGYPNDLLLRLGEHDARLVQPAVRPVYADEVSGLRIHKVIVPISGILMRGAWRRWMMRDEAPRPHQ